MEPLQVSFLASPLGLMQIPAETSLHVGCSENALEFQPGRRIKDFLREAVDAIQGRLLSKISIARITTTAGLRQSGTSGISYQGWSDESIGETPI